MWSAKEKYLASLKCGSLEIFVPLRISCRLTFSSASCHSLFLAGFRMDADINQILILQPPVYQPGTLKTLLAQNKYNLRLLEKQFGRGIHLDAKITKRELQFIGKEAQYQELLVSCLKIFRFHKRNFSVEWQTYSNQVKLSNLRVK